MPDLPDPLERFDWSRTTFEGARLEQLRRWAKLPLDRIIAALEEMDDLARELHAGRKSRPTRSEP